MRCITILSAFLLGVVTAQAQTLTGLPLSKKRTSLVQMRTTRSQRNEAQSEMRSNTTGQSLPIRRVVLYSNGVAYFERRGTVTGRAEINLSFKQSQIDDVLKSMVVLDLGQGKIGAVSYNSSAPTSARLAEIPFSIEAGTSPSDNMQGGLAGVLRQLQGARVLVTTSQNRTATGAILTIEERRSQIDANKLPVTAYSLVISSNTGELINFDLADVRSVRLIDEGARRDLTRFADASAAARRRDAKTIVVTSDGVGPREMVISYTVAAPIWKTTYRVVMDSSGKPFFQGWAIVDNVSEEDWTNVSLSLVSGTPVSFIHPIQQPLYRYREVIPIPDNLNLDPQVYETTIGRGEVVNYGGGGPGGGGGVAAGGGAGRGSAASGNASITGQVTDSFGAVVPNARVLLSGSTGFSTTVNTDSNGSFSFSRLPGAATYTLIVESSGFKRLQKIGINLPPGGNLHVGNLILEVGAVTETVNVTASVSSTDASNRASAGMRVAVSDAITGGNAGVETAARGSEVGDLFEYRVDQPVTVRRDRSALIPILQTRMEGERISIYNEAVRKDRPMSGLLLKNISPLTLEDGSLTVLDGDAYAGESLIERLKPGEDRFISFALDLGTLVNASSKNERSPVFLIRVVNGVFQAHYYQNEKKGYTIVNQTDRPRVVYIEHPVRQDWSLSKETPKPFERTSNLYRFRIELGPHQTVEVPISEQRALMDTYAILNLTRDDLVMFTTKGYLDEATRAALEKVLEAKSRIAALDGDLNKLDEEIAEIERDQKRLRENIEALGTTAEARQLIARYVAKAGEQETRIEQIRTERKRINEQRTQHQASLNTTLRAFVVDRKL